MSRWILVLVCVLSGCVAAPDTDRSDPGIFSGLFGPDTAARSPAPGPPPPASPAAGASDVIYTSGIAPTTAGGAPAAAGASSSDSGKTYSLNFEGVDIATAAKALLGDILKQPYSIDPRVTGQLSFASARPISVRDLLFVVESALTADGAALIKAADGYHIIPAVEAPGAGDTTYAQNGSTEPGYGISILPIRYVSAATLQQLMDGFSSKPGMLRIEASRNLLLVQGTGVDRTVAMQAALAFDADWMRDQSVGVFRLENSTAATVIGELDQIFETADNGLGRDLIKFRPIERLNAVMAVSKRRELVERAGAWVRRLDASSTTSPHVYVYQLRYGDAKSIAGILSDMFGGGQSATQPVSPDSNIAVAVTAPPTDQSAPPTDQFGNPVPAPSPDTSASTPPSSPSSSAPGSNTGVKISADLSNNSLVILADGDTYKKIQAALRQIDIPRLQVAVHAIVAEVTLNDALKNGVEFFLKSSNLGLGTDAGSIGFGTTSVLKRVIPGFNFLLGSAKDPQLVLSALDTVTNVKIISSPSIVVTNNQKATLQVGAQVPVATREATDVTDPNAPIVNNIEFRDTGVILKVTPKINDNGVVNMDIEQEISAVSKESAAGTLTPVISTRKVSSSISVVSGQTVVLGGLISEQSDTTANGLPYLNRLKFLGILGGKRTLDHTRTEIIMFIRPEIIRNGGDAENVTNDMALQLRDMIGPGSGDANQISK